MKQYLDLCRRVLEQGIEKPDRTGTGTLSVFGAFMEIDLKEGFPLLTTKDLGEARWRGIVYELFWFLRGDTNIKYLVDNGVNIWNRDAYRWFMQRYPNSPISYEEFIQEIKQSRIFAHEAGDLGAIYGKQWRAWEKDEQYDDVSFIDQIASVIKQIKENPHDRRHMVVSWNVPELSNMALPPCHYAFQFYVDNNGLNCAFVMRSSDVFLGLPYNLASYALLTHMVAQVCGLEVGKLQYHNTGDVHIYKNHIEQVKEQLTREPRDLPKLTINRNVMDIGDFCFEDFTLDGYDPYPPIKGEMSS